MAEAYHGRGNAYRKQGSADRAMADLDEALRLQPVLAAAFIDRGNVYLERRSLDEAIQDYDKAISIMRMGAYHGPTGELEMGTFSARWLTASSTTGAKPRLIFKLREQKRCWSRHRSET